MLQSFASEIHFCVKVGDTCPLNFATSKITKMEKLVCVNENYRIWQLDKESLHELAEFVVTENYKHHVGSFTAASIKAEVDSVFQEELQYIDSSIIFAVRNMMGKIIGSIRVFKWDRKKTLPVQKIFGVNPLSSIHTEVDYNYWHIGRFAIDSFSGIPTITLFKQLMIYAIHPIVCDDKSYMIAETDSKLLTVMNALVIQTVQLGDSVNYLASETVPIYSSKIGLLPFYNHFRKLYQAS